MVFSVSVNGCVSTRFGVIICVSIIRVFAQDQDVGQGGEVKNSLGDTCNG